MNLNAIAFDNEIKVIAKTLLRSKTWKSIIFK